MWYWIFERAEGAGHRTRVSIATRLSRRGLIAGATSTRSRGPAPIAWFLALSRLSPESRWSLPQTRAMPSPSLYGLVTNKLSSGGACGVGYLRQIASLIAVPRRNVGSMHRLGPVPALSLTAALRDVAAAGSAHLRWSLPSGATRSRPRPAPPFRLWRGRSADPMASRITSLNSAISARRSRVFADATFAWDTPKGTSRRTMASIKRRSGAGLREFDIQLN
jgi:hypothetical protein